MSKDKKYSEDFSKRLNHLDQNKLQDELILKSTGLKGAVLSLGYSEDYWNAMCHDVPSHRHEFDQRDPQRVREVFPSDDKGSPAFLLFIMIGMVMGCVSVIIAMTMGLRLLPILAVYCSVGSAVTLGSAVVFALLKTESCGPE